MALRGLFALLIGLTMVLAPLGMPAMAAAPGGHHQMMTDHAADMAQPMNHCGGKADQPGKAADKNCCAATCVGLAIAPSPEADPPHFGGIALRPAIDLFRNGIPLELPTPPPRSA